MFFIFEIFFYASVVFILLLGLYPVFAKIGSLLFRRPELKSKPHLQPVSIIIACFNEEKYIKQKLDAFLNNEEWIESSEIIVVSAGSTDSTNQILSEYTRNPFVKIIFAKTQLSKISAVNLAVKEAKHELLVFSDCRQKMKKGSVRQLIRNFNNPEIGTVTATLKDNDRTNRWSFRNLLNFVALCESKSGSCLNVFGALYAQRKSVYREFPTDLLFDDLFVVVSTITQKKRVIMEPEAIIYDVPFHKYYLPERIQRLARGLLIFLTRQFNMILRLPFITLFRFIVFKYFKLILPFAIIITTTGFIVMMCLQMPLLNISLPILLLFLVLLLIKRVRLIISHFLIVNYYFLIATIQFAFFNKRSNRWEKLKVK